MVYWIKLSASASGKGNQSWGQAREQGQTTSVRFFIQRKRWPWDEPWRTSQIWTIIEKEEKYSLY